MSSDASSNDTGSAAAEVVVAVVATHVAPAKGYGGIAECVARLAHTWTVQGRRFTLCSSAASRGRPLTVADLGLPPQVPVHLFQVGRFPSFALGWGALGAVWRACRVADVVYVNGLGTWPTTLAGLLALVLRRRLVIALHAGLMAPHVALIRRRKPHKWLFYEVFTLPAVRRAAALHLTSALEEPGLEVWAPGVPRFVVPNGLDLDAWRPQAPADGDRQGLTLCYIGRFSPEKGILRFLRAWKASRRRDDRLILVGSGSGVYADALLAEAESLGDAVERHDYLTADGVRAVLAASDMLVLPSGLENGDLRENFGNVVAEALACARPVMVTRGLAWDMAEDDGFGLLFEPTEAGLTDALVRARALDRTTLRAMGAAGRAHAERHLDIRRTADRIWRGCAGVVAE